MGSVSETISPALIEWVGQQHIFFVATAPLTATGHVNCSPKGLDTLRILDPQQVAYLDFTGSGVETIAHLRENGRIVLMFCALNGPPNIVRFYGKGTAITPDAPEWPSLLAHFPEYPGVRAIIRVDVTRVSESCGYGVPKYEFSGERDTLQRWVQSKGEDALVDYRKEKNRRSIDGLPGLDVE